jgi:hypothetical protein
MAGTTACRTPSLAEMRVHFSRTQPATTPMQLQRVLSTLPSMPQGLLRMLPAEIVHHS